MGGDTEPLVGLWPLFGLLIQTPALQLRLAREEDLPALARAARDIAGPGEPRLQMPWMYDDSPAMERQLLQRHWRALAHWRPEHTGLVPGHRVSSDSGARLRMSRGALVRQQGSMSLANRAGHQSPAHRYLHQDHALGMPGLLLNVYFTSLISRVFLPGSLQTALSPPAGPR
jgi:hypothetical protein